MPQGHNLNILGKKIKFSFQKHIFSLFDLIMPQTGII